MTIQIYLPSGDPQGIRIAEITTRTVRVLDVPRTEIKSFFEMPESDQVAVYYLFGEEAGISGPNATLGGPTPPDNDSSITSKIRPSGLTP